MDALIEESVRYMEGGLNRCENRSIKDGLLFFVHFIRKSGYLVRGT